MKDNSLYIDPAYRKEFMQEISWLNVQRGKLFAAIIMVIEFVLLLIMLFYHTDNIRFHYQWYTFMYILMIVVTAMVSIFFSYLEKHRDNDTLFAKAIELTTMIYIIFLMTWGAVISLVDQALYGNIVAFIVNVLFASFMFYKKNAHIFMAQLIASGVLFIGLPYYQPSRDIIIGHYINISIFLVFAWVMARSNYNNYLQNFMNQKLIEEKSILLEEINKDLVIEIQTRKQAQKELEAANEQLMTISTLDALTGIPNRRSLDESIKEHWATAITEQQSISLMMIDIDFFKLYNDSNGHLAGDRCLQSVARVLNECRRGGKDFVARYGGEEFLFVATNISREETLSLAEKIRMEIEGLAFKHNISSISPYVTASIGISWLIPTSTDKLADNIEQADRALYQAKQDGRNRVIIANSTK